MLSLINRAVRAIDYYDQFNKLIFYFLPQREFIFTRKGGRRASARDCADLQRQRGDDFEAGGMSYFYNDDVSDFVMLSDAQFQKLLTAIGSLNRGGIHWEQVLPVFLSALLAMMVGIALELVKRRYDRTKSEKESKKKEL
jgi:hypothetical protein